jgi:hypothetical protein
MAVTSVISARRRGGLAGESWSCAFECKPVIRTGWYLKLNSEGLIDGALLIVGVVGGITVDTDFASTYPSLATCPSTASLV